MRLFCKVISDVKNQMSNEILLFFINGLQSYALKRQKIKLRILKILRQAAHVYICVLVKLATMRLFSGYTAKKMVGRINVTDIWQLRRREKAKAETAVNYLQAK